MTDKRAISIEGLLTWAYQRELVAAGDSGSGLWGMERGVAALGQDSVLTVAQAAALGAIIPSTGGGYAALQFAPPDAEALHRLVYDLLPRLTRGVVVHYAARGERPAEGGLPRLVAQEVRLATGKPVYRFDRSYYKGSYPWLCDLRYEPAPKESLAQRAVYRTWREGLRVLMVQLLLRPHLLARWRVTEELPRDLPPLPAWVGALVSQSAGAPKAFSYVGISKAS